MDLNERQLDILRWIGEGTPEREWPTGRSLPWPRVRTTRLLVAVYIGAPATVVDLVVERIFALLVDPLLA